LKIYDLIDLHTNVLVNIPVINKSLKLYKDFIQVIQCPYNKQQPFSLYIYYYSITKNG